MPSSPRTRHLEASLQRTADFAATEEKDDLLAQPDIDVPGIKCASTFNFHHPFTIANYPQGLGPAVDIGKDDIMQPASDLYNVVFAPSTAPPPQQVRIMNINRDTYSCWQTKSVLFTLALSS